MCIGFIGLGSMGSAMAANLYRFAVTVSKIKVLNLWNAAVWAAIFVDGNMPL